VDAGKITSKTLVWNPDMADWDEYARVMTDSAGIAAADGAGGSEKSFCAECERAFPREEMIRCGNSWVCAGCKPIFVQKLKEGMTVSGAMEYAGFWLRFGAKFIDWIIVGAANAILSLAAGLMMFPALSSPNSLAAFILPLFLQLFQIAVTAVYTTWFLGKYAATPGKMACGLKVVTGDGDRVSYLRALGRYFAEMISAVILCIGYIMAAFDEQKRALHDRICDTRVIRK
jgi:uncharacterized RDD family membrane protein YckC